MVRDLKDQSKAANLDNLLFFHMGTVEEGAEFFAKHWPEARSVSDPTCQFYEAFGAALGSAGDFLNPKVGLATVRALFRGHGVGKHIGDWKRMPALLVVEKGEVVWQAKYGSIADRTPVKEIVEYWRSRAAD